MAPSDVRDAWRGVASLDTLLALVSAVALFFLGYAVHQRKRDPPEVVAYDQGSPYWAISPLMNNEYKNESEQVVSGTALWLICVFVPLAIFLLLSAVDAVPAATALRCQGFLYAFGATSLVTECVKRYCGYWRPYFYDECDFSSTTGKCEGDDYESAYRSFPSGHSSMSMFSLLYASWCLLGAARLGRPLRVGGVDVGGPAVMACLAPFGLAVFIAASRVVDNDHWPADVVTGAVIGGGFATLFYHRYFPFVFEDASHLPRAGFVSKSSLPPAGSEGELEAVRSAGAT
mmetsp:Transcript_20727/g.62007  ORF Transcript_20727/g.62007 Transcript_20727/m.62007 type:complete len:288 (+) Transcript_20727:341-1204(+)